MLRILLSIIILTLLITYAIIPFVKYLKKFFKREGERIDKAFTSNGDEDEEKEND